MADDGEKKNEPAAPPVPGSERFAGRLLRGVQH
jgi:hypothetical protein